MKVSSAKEKENLVIELLKKGHTTMEITKMAHVSNTTINKTRQKTTKNANEDDQKKKPLSVSSQAFRLFLEGKSIVQVAIGLDLPQSRF